MRAILEDLEISVFEKVMQVNFLVPCIVPSMPCLISSMPVEVLLVFHLLLATKACPARTAYSASKFAMHGFLESLRIENLEKGLHVLTACPGFTESNIRKTALSKDGTIQAESPRDEATMMTADEVAEKVYNSTINRQNSLVLTINGKLTVLLNKFFS